MTNMLIIDNFNEESTLLDLSKDNLGFAEIKNSYYKKLETTQSFLTKEEFINKELERIKNLFIQPSEIIPVSENIVGGFNYTLYQKSAYDWLSMGQNWTLKQIISSAKQHYLSKMPSFGHFEEKQFSEAIIQNLARGVSWLVYEKFLKDELKSSSLTKELRVKQGKKNRKKVPEKTRAFLQKEVQSCCPFCVSDDVGYFEVHHIDENPENNDLNNLLMVCPTCHSKISKGDIAVEVVRKKKDSYRKQ